MNQYLAKLSFIAMGLTAIIGVYAVGQLSTSVINWQGLFDDTLTFDEHCRMAKGSGDNFTSIRAQQPTFHQQKRAFTGNRRTAPLLRTGNGNGP